MRRIVLLLSIVLLAGGCADEGPVRSARNAEIERVEFLGQVEEAHWVTELTKGTDPTQRWMQGVARLRPADFDRLRQSQKWQPVSTEPIMPKDLNGKLDPGDTWLLGEVEDDLFYLESYTRFVLFMVYD